MLLTVSTTHRPATDLGFLLHKHPERVQEFSQSFGVATVFYPEASEQRCTAALLLEIDPVRLARGRGAASPGFSLGHYVNDRPYVASSLLAVSLADVFRTARAGRCPARPQLADTAIPLQITIPGLPCRGGPDIAHRVFGPLGWEVVAEPIPLDEAFPEWGDSPYLHLTLTGVVRLADALNQLHVLLPALDESKHYWQGPAEVEMLLRSGEGWLSTHPERELITRRYLSHLGELTTVALARLAELDDEVDHARGRGEDDDAGQPEPRRTPLARQRHEAVLEELRTLGAGSVIDLGCGSGDLLRRLLESPSLTRLAGCDVSMRSLSERRAHGYAAPARQDPVGADLAGDGVDGGGQARGDRADFTEGVPARAGELGKQPGGARQLLVRGVGSRQWHPASREDVLVVARDGHPDVPVAEHHRPHEPARGGQGNLDRAAAVAHRGGQLDRLGGGQLLDEVGHGRGTQPGQFGDLHLSERAVLPHRVEDPQPVHLPQRRRRARRRRGSRRGRACIHGLNIT